MNINALFNISYGVYIVCSFKDKKYNGFIANTISQVTSEPITLQVIVNKNNLTHDYMMSSKLFSVSILTEEAPLKFIGHFGFKSGKDIDKFDKNIYNFNYKIHETSVPIITDYSNSYLICKIIKEIDVNTHTIFIADLIDCDIISNANSMTYKYYHEIKKGKTAKNAPTYINLNNYKKEENKMQKYVCDVCGYVYDPELGDPDNGISPGTPFEQIPDSWVCPICGAGKDQFSKV